MKTSTLSRLVHRLWTWHSIGTRLHSLFSCFALVWWHKADGKPVFSGLEKCSEQQQSNYCFSFRKKAWGKRSWHGYSCSFVISYMSLNPHKCKVTHKTDTSKVWETFCTCILCMEAASFRKERWGRVGNRGDASEWVGLLKLRGGLALHLPGDKHKVLLLLGKPCGQHRIRSSALL